MLSAKRKISIALYNYGIKFYIAYFCHFILKKFNDNEGYQVYCH